MWPILIGSLIGALAQAMGSLVGRALIALGVGFVTYQGFNMLGSWTIGAIKSSLTGMGAEIAGLLGFLWIDKAISMIASAWSAALAIRLAGGTDLTKMIIRK